MTIISSSFFKKLVFLGLILLLLIGIWFFWRHAPSDSKIPEITVKSAFVTVKPIAVEINIPGSVEPFESVNVRSQVNGIIKKIHVREGEFVKKGQLLFELDPEPLVALLHQEEANLIRDQAQLRASQLNANRFSQLIGKGYVSKQENDQVRSTAEMHRAMVKADKEKINQAKIQVSYTKIYAPFPGKTGNIEVEVGDVISAVSTNPLVVINQLDPILINFNLPQNELSRLLKYHRLNSIMVEVWDEQTHQLLGKGDLNFINNTVNSATGTILLKAKMSNAKGLLWPGLMLSVKVILTVEPKALVLPEVTVKFDDKGAFVYQIVQGKAVIKRVKIDRHVNSWSVITEGLSKGDEVVLSGPPDLPPGSKVKVLPGNAHEHP